ncbi:MAG: VOC family protein [Bacteroidia bacterium]
MELLKKIHHVAIICSDYDVSKKFYTELLGFKIEHEVYREEKKSHKLDLSLNGQYVIELFSFVDPPRRASWPEARGLRNIAFEVNNIIEVTDYLKTKTIYFEPIRTDEFTHKKFTFIFDPDGLPIELYEK